MNIPTVTTSSSTLVLDQRLTIRLAGIEKIHLEAQAQRAGQKVSTWARNKLLELESPDNDLERRVARLEEMAGL